MSLPHPHSRAQSGHLAAEAARLFEDLAVELEDGRGDAEALFAAHPALEAELRNLYRGWLAADALFRLMAAEESLVGSVRREIKVVGDPRRATLSPFDGPGVPWAAPMDPAERLSLDAPAIAGFCREHGILRLALFGSVLRDDFRPDSDVDVLVEFEPGRSPSFFGLFDLEEALRPLLGGRRVDLRTAEDLSRHFRAEVVSTSRPLYDAA